MRFSLFETGKSNVKGSQTMYVPAFDAPMTNPRIMNEINYVSFGKPFSFEFERSP